MNYQSLVIVFSLFLSISTAQEVLTLQACLNLVESNSLQIASESKLLNSSKVNRQFHWWSLLPNVSGNVGVNTSFGRRLDPFTNTFATSSVNSQSFGLNSSMQLFGGFSYFYKRNSLNAAIARDEIGLNKKQNELKIQAVETYLALCKLSVQIQLTESRIEKYNQIQTLQRFLIKEGRINVIDTLKSQHSLLREQDLLLNLRNESKLRMLELNFQMNVPLSKNYLVDLESVFDNGEQLHFTEVYEIELMETDFELLENELKSQRSAILPSISLNGLIGTGFSTNNKDYSLPGTPTKSYPRQMNENLYEGIGLYLNIPVFNRGEWLKTRRLNSFQHSELTSRMELADRLLEKQRLEREQKRLNVRARLEQNKQLIENLQLIYAKSRLLYEEGRLTYPEMELTLMDWQLKIAENEVFRFDLKLLELFD